jgi:hypothetical protein
VLRHGRVQVPPSRLGQRPGVGSVIPAPRKPDEETTAKLAVVEEEGKVCRRQGGQAVPFGLLLSAGAEAQCFAFASAPADSRDGDDLLLTPCTRRAKFAADKGDKLSPLVSCTA